MPRHSREVESGDDADLAERMPLLVHAMLHALRLHGATVKHARLTDGQLADVDHLLHLAVAFFFDLAGFHGDQTAQRGFVAAQGFHDYTHQLAATRGRYHAPAREGRHSVVQNEIVLIARAAACPAQHTLSGRIDGSEMLRGRKPLRPQAYAGVALDESELARRYVRQVHGDLPLNSKRTSGGVAQIGAQIGQHGPQCRDRFVDLRT